MTDSRPRRLLVIGGMSIDHITTAEGITHLDVPGGNAAFAAIGAKVWGVVPAIVGLVGADYPESWISALADAGIEMHGIQRRSEPHENHFAVRYLNDRDRVPYVPIDAFEAAGQPVPGSLQGMAAVIDAASDNAWTSNDETRSATWRSDPDAVPDDLWAADAVLVVPAALDRQQLWVDRCRAMMRTDALLLLDPEEEQGRDLTERDLAPLLASVVCFLPSRRQVEAIGPGGSDLSTTARRLAALGPRVVAIKLGEAGCLVYDRVLDRQWRIPVVTTEIADVTGAGDAFCGGFAAGYMTTGDPETAGLFGAVSASFAIEGFGLFDALRHTPDDARTLLEALRRSPAAPPALTTHPTT